MNEKKWLSGWHAVERFIASVAFPDDDFGFASRVIDIRFLVCFQHKIRVAMRALAVFRSKQFFSSHFSPLVFSPPYGHKGAREVP